MAIVGEAREDAALLGLGFRLVVQAYFLKALFGQLVVALATAGLLHRRARSGTRAARIKGSSGIYRSACIERLTGIRLVDIVDNGRPCRDVLMPCQRALEGFEQLDGNSQMIAYMSRSSRGKC